MLSPRGNGLVLLRTLVYVGLVLGIPLDVDLVLDVLVIALNVGLVLAIDVDLVLAIALVIALVIDLDVCLVIALTIGLGVALELSCAIAPSDKVCSLVRGRTHTPEWTMIDVHGQRENSRLSLGAK